MTPTNAHKAALATLATQTGALKSFLAENTGKMTDAHLKTAQGLRDAAAATKLEVERHVAEAGLADEVAGLDSFNSDPAGNGIKAMGWSPAGSNTLDRNTGTMTAEGPGIFGAKVWDGIKDPSYTKAFGEYLRKGERMSNAAYKALEVGTDTQGGYLAPPETLQRLVERKPTPTRVASMVDTIVCGRDSITIPKVNYGPGAGDEADLYSTGFRTSWTGEKPNPNGSRVVNDANLFGDIRIDNFTNMIEGIITNDMAEDGMFDVAKWMENKFSETVDILKDDMIFNGSGIRQPTGIIPFAIGNPAGMVIDATAAGSGDITPDDIIDTAFDVPEQYEENLRWYMSKTQAAKYIRKFKDTQGRYLFGYGTQDSGLAVGRVPELAGYPVTFTGLVKARLDSGTKKFASGAYAAVFGDLKGYSLVNRIGFSVQVCKELLARQNQLLLIGRLRLGGMPIEPWRLRVLRAKV